MLMCNIAQIDPVYLKVEEVFHGFKANCHDRVDVLAKSLAYTFAYSFVPDRDTEFVEFVRLTRRYLDQYDLLRAAPAGIA